jgi:26S proteasome non-ATPase regulatory subunit 9
MGIDTPLVDSEGYPRGDIDVFRARTLRRRFIEIQNDHKAVMAKIEKGLAELQLVVVSFVCVF